MLLKFKWENLTSDKIGEKGIFINEIKELKREIENAKNKLKNEKESGKIGFWQLPYNEKSVKEVNKLADYIRENFEYFVLLGIGGSALGPISLHNALKSPYYNLLPYKKRNAPKMFFIDNVDPNLMYDLKEIIDVKKTVFVVVTKSGGTAETLANYLIARKWVIDEVGKENVNKHFIGITDPQKGFLRKVINEENWKSLSIPPNVGGRFSIFTPVGLLSAAVENINIEELLEGAKKINENFWNEDIFDNLPVLHGVFQYLFYKKGKNISVLMPYSNSLYSLADWYRQLWAESLGKKYDLKGNVVNVGQTPVKALGTTDQHSQIQLYVEGPDDKIITFIKVEYFENDMVMPLFHHEDDTINYLGNKNISKLLNTECEATAIALTQSKKPNCMFILPSIIPFYLGQLYFLFEIETSFVGALLNINPYDQPGVEAGKIATYKMMGRRGY